MVWVEEEEVGGLGWVVGQKRPVWETSPPRDAVRMFGFALMSGRVGGKGVEADPECS